MSGHDIVFYDGACGLCHSLVRFVLARDPVGRHHFAPLQGRTAAEILSRHGRRAAALQTVFLLQQDGLPQARLLEGPAAVLAVLRALGGGWRRLGGVLSLAPAPLARLVYGLVARHRYRLFGQRPDCPLPAPGERQRFLP